MPVTQDDESSNTPQIPEDHFEYQGILNHRTAPQGCGSRYEVLIDWNHHNPTWVPVNIFSDNKLNTKACETLALYAQQNGILATKGWKGYNKYLTITNPNKPTLTIKQQNFFEKCFHLQQANKAINPDTGTL